MSTTRRAPAAVWLASLGLACSTLTGGPGPSGDGAVAARVAGDVIRVEDVDAHIKEQLFERATRSGDAARLYEMRAAALEEIVDERLLADAVAESGLDREAYLTREARALGPVRDEEVAAFFERHRGRIREKSLEEATPRILRFLESEKRNEVVAGLRESADVEIALQPPRMQVAATGPSLGPAEAPVTIVEFSDYQCPYCARAEPIVKQVLERYPEEVRFVYRHLPLDIHPQAHGAAVAAVCAEAQGRFWDYHAVLFENQRALATEELERYAAQLELDLDAFRACTSDPKSTARVDADLRDARRAGASGTPAFFVNGILITGAKPVAEFVRVIDAELERLGTP